MVQDAASAGGLAHHSHVIWIPADEMDVARNPLASGALVPEPGVGQPLLLHGFAREEPKGAEPVVAADEDEVVAGLRNEAAPVVEGEPEVLKLIFGAEDVAAAVDPVHDGEGGFAADGFAGDVHVEEEAVFGAAGFGDGGEDFVGEELVDGGGQRVGVRSEDVEAVDGGLRTSVADGSVLDGIAGWGRGRFCPSEVAGGWCCKPDVLECVYILD